MHRRSLALLTLFCALHAWNSHAVAPAKASAREWKPRVARSQSVPKVSRYPEAECAEVRLSVLRDLPEFCDDENLDQIRLIDFGGQLELLEQRCGDRALAEKLRRALGEKAHRRNHAACRKTAEELRHAAPGASTAAAPAEGF